MANIDPPRVYCFSNNFFKYSGTWRPGDWSKQGRGYMLLNDNNTYIEADFTEGEIEGEGMILKVAVLLLFL